MAAGVWRLEVFSAAAPPVQVGRAAAAETLQLWRSQRGGLTIFLRCDPPPHPPPVGPRCVFMVQQTHNRKEIRASKKHRRSSSHSRSAFPSVPIKLIRRPPACRFMSGGGVGDSMVGGRRETCALLHQNGRLFNQTCL